METLMRNTNVELALEVVDKKGEKIGPSYTTQIVQVNAVDDIDILAPTFDKYTIPLPIDTDIKIFLKTASSEKIFLNGVVVSKSNTENKILLKIRLNDGKSKNPQNALAVKIDCNLKAEYLQVNLKDSVDFNLSKVISISEHKLTLLVNEDIDLHELLNIFIWISDRKTINAICVVTEKKIWSNTNEYRYQMELEFTEITESAKDAIIKYIFKKQKEYLKKV
ncbi:MAG TPA: hypothetical protein GX727_02665 [Clostridium sp.]|jgi:c-di-GMP-binding flagellar brake protein YcgR|nr:hypothetical protein [Clostridium sp.]